MYLWLTVAVFSWFAQLAISGSNWELRDQACEGDVDQEVTRLAGFMLTTVQ